MEEGLKNINLAEELNLKKISSQLSSISKHQYIQCSKCNRNFHIDFIAGHLKYEREIEEMSKEEIKLERRDSNIKLFAKQEESDSVLTK